MTSNQNKTDQEFFVFTSTKGKEYLIPIKYEWCTSVKEIIIQMSQDGFSPGKLSKSTGILNQHVNNTLKEQKSNEYVTKMIQELKNSSK